MNVIDMITGAAMQTPAPGLAHQVEQSRSVIRYFIAQPLNLRTGEAMPGSIPFVFTRECLNHRPANSTAIVPGKGWCNVAEITASEWLKVTLAQKAHNDAQDDGGAPARLIPVQPQLPPGGVSVDPVPAATAKPRKLTGIAARVAAGMAK